jgi:hypothetical protein
MAHIWEQRPFPTPERPGTLLKRFSDVEDRQFAVSIFDISAETSIQVAPVPTSGLFPLAQTDPTMTAIMANASV